MIRTKYRPAAVEFYMPEDNEDGEEILVGVANPTTGYFLPDPEVQFTAQDLIQIAEVLADLEE